MKTLVSSNPRCVTGWAPILRGLPGELRRDIAQPRVGPVLSEAVGQLLAGQPAAPTRLDRDEASDTAAGHGDVDVLAVAHPGQHTGRVVAQLT